MKAATTSPSDRWVHRLRRPLCDTGMGEQDVLLVEQVGAIDSRRVGELVRHLTPEEMWGIDEALLTVLGLN